MGKLEKPVRLKPRDKESRREEELREREARFRALTELSSDWYWEQDAELRFVSTGGLTDARGGITAAAHIGKRRWELPNTEIVNQTWDEHRAVLEARQPFHDLLLRRTDAHGRVHLVSVSGRPIFDSSGTFSGYLGIASDVTERKGAEEELRQSEARFRALTELSSDWYWEQDERFRFRRLAGPGAAANARSGDPSVYIGKARWEIPDLAPVDGGWAEHRAQLQRHEPFRDLVLRRQMDDGTVRYMAISGEPILDANGDFAGYRGIGRDVTQQKRAEEDLRRFKLAMDGSADMILLVDRTTMRFIDANSTVCRLLGFTREELLEMRLEDLLPISRAELEAAYDRQIADPSVPGGLISYYRCKDGSHLPFESKRQVLRSGNNWLISIVSRDIRERLVAERTLRDSEAQLRLVTDNVPAMIAYFDAECRYRYANLKYREFHAGSSESIIGKTLEEVLGEEIGRLVRADLVRALNGEARNYVRRIRGRDDGSVRDLEVWLVPHRDEAGMVRGVYALLLDETRRRRAEESLQLRTRAIEASVNSIMITEPTSDGQEIVYVNPAFERITGYSSAEVMGKSPNFLHGEDRDQKGVKGLQAATRELREATVLLRNYRKDGTLFWNELHVAPVRDSAGRVSHFIGVGNDVSERIRYQEEIERQANYDSLTGLPNRNLLNDRLAQATVQARRSGQPFAVMFVDLDHVKRINDSLGHPVGDQVIATIGQRIAEMLRLGDTVARIGGDEFVVLLENLTRENDAAAVAIKVMNVVGTPLKVEGREFVLTASIGVALYPKDGADAATLLRNADTALYRAKAAGRDCFRFFAAEMNERAVQFLTMENDLRKALAAKEFRLQYQPIVTIATREVVGAEALVRWGRSDGSVVSPVQFIPVAEESGLITPIGRWVLETATRQASEWNRRQNARLYVSINLSARQFRDPQLVGMVRSVLESAKVDPALITLELTESTVMQNAEEAIATLKVLKELGVKLALDDFGTGYSSLAYLKRFPIDVLKIDRAFVRDLQTDREDRALSRAIVDLARALQLDVVAEGVETQRQSQILADNGCMLAQGNLFGRPVDPEKFGLPQR